MTAFAYKDWVGAVRSRIEHARKELIDDDNHYVDAYQADLALRQAEKSLERLELYIHNGISDLATRLRRSEDIAEEGWNYVTDERANDQKNVSLLKLRIRDLEYANRKLRRSNSGK